MNPLNLTVHQSILFALKGDQRAKTRESTKKSSRERIFKEPLFGGGKNHSLQGLVYFKLDKETNAKLADLQGLNQA